MKYMNWINKFPFLKTIKFRLLLFASVMSLVPLLVLGGYNLKAARDNLETSVHYHQALVSSSIAEDISSMLEEAKRTFSVIAKADGIKLPEMSLKDREGILYACLTSLPYIDEISALDATGRELAHVSRLRVTTGTTGVSSIPEKSTDIIDNLQSHEIFMGSVYIDEWNQPAFDLAIPFFDRTHSLTGAIIAKISLRSIVERISLVSGEKEEHIFLVDEQGRLIGHEDYSQVLRHQDVRESLPSPVILKTETQEGVPLVRNYRSYTGENVVGSYVPVKGTAWAVILEEPERYAFASFDKLKNTFELSTLGLILTVLGISLIFGLSFSRRLETLKQGVRRVVKGESGIILPVKVEDEIGEVLLAFNHLSQELERKKQMEAAMRQADKMVTVGLLAAGVAHEINNPLAAIFLSVEELLERLNEGELGPEERLELRRYLKTIAEQSERCSRITHQLLEFSHQSPNEEPQESPYDLNDLIAKNIGLIRFCLRKQNIQIKENYAVGLPFLWGDGSGIQQVVFNLICNAMDAMPDGGVLSLSTEFDKEWIKFSVRDTGIGIPQEYLTRIFEPFFTTKPVGKGTGLGLSVCYGVIEKSQGKIEIESSEGMGTVVRVFLPRKGDKHE